MLYIVNSEDLLKLTSTRIGETKLGQSMHTVSSPEELKDAPGRFVLLGIAEDIGIRANLGQPGAADCWTYALQSLCNVQSNSFLSGTDITVLGSLEFKDLQEEASGLDPANPKDLQRLRELTAAIDPLVAETVGAIARAGKTPMVVGGGHNNAYGNIKGVSKAHGKAINVINIDPHTDYRSSEGRHSGNGFRYARKEGYLDRYLVWGMHESYNGSDIIDIFKEDPNLFYESFDELLRLDTPQMEKRLLNGLNWLGMDANGLELDLDSITGFPVSALNPSGFSLNQIRRKLATIVSHRPPSYFHICEGSPGRAVSDVDREMLGKSIAYLITDFVKLAR